MELDIIRSNRKTISIQITHDGRVQVRAPRRLSQREILRFVESKSAWIEKHLSRLQPAGEPFAAEELQSLAEQARADIPNRVARFAPLVGVSYGRITIRAQVSRWGSCSARGNLNFNCLLMLTPPEVRDYVVVHELCHRKQMNHSPAFWSEVRRCLPEYEIRRNWLREHGGGLIARLR